MAEDKTLYLNESESAALNALEMQGHWFAGYFNRQSEKIIEQAVKRALDSR